MVGDAVFPGAASVAAAQELLRNAPVNPPSAHPAGIAPFFVVTLRRDVLNRPVCVGRFWQGTRRSVGGYFTASPLQGKGNSVWEALGSRAGSLDGVGWDGMLRMGFWGGFLGCVPFPRRFPPPSHL